MGSRCPGLLTRGPARLKEAHSLPSCRPHSHSSLRAGGGEPAIWAARCQEVASQAGWREEGTLGQAHLAPSHTPCRAQWVRTVGPMGTRMTMSRQAAGHTGAALGTLS